MRVGWPHELRRGRQASACPIIPSSLGGGMQGHVVGQEAGQDVMQLLVKVEGAPESLASAVAETARALTGPRAEVALAPLGSLPDNGAVIEDRRPRD